MNENIDIALILALIGFVGLDIALIGIIIILVKNPIE